MNTQSELTQPEGTYWHFIHGDNCLAHRDGRKVVAGETLKVEGEIATREWGLHASKNILDALSHASSPILCLVTLGGKVIHENGLSVAEERTVLWKYDTWYMLREYICNVLEDHIDREGRAGYKVDPRCMTALEVSRRHLHGEATNDELKAATDSIWEAKREAPTGADGWPEPSANDYAAWLVLQIPESSWGYQNPHVTAKMTRRSECSEVNTRQNEMLTTMLMTEYNKEHH